MSFFMMNWFIVVGMVSAFLLGWALGIWIGTTKGYDAAIEEQRERESQDLWSNYINRFNGGKQNEK